MINVNEFKEFVDTITNKDENGGFSVPQFNIALPVVVFQYIDRCMKFLRDYQVGTNKNFALVAKYERALFDLIVKTNVSVSATGLASLPIDWYDTKGVNYNYVTQNPLTVTPYPIREVEAQEFSQYESSQLNKPNKKHAIVTYLNGTLKFSPKDLGNAEFIYYKEAPAPVWGFTIVNNEAVYDSTTSVDIPLSPQTNNDLAFMFCQYLGLAIKDQYVENFAQQEETKH